MAETEHAACGSKPASSSNSDENGDAGKSRVVTIATTSDRLPDEQKLFAKLGVVNRPGLIGRLLGKKIQLADDQKFKDGTLVTEVDNCTVAISLMPAAIPGIESQCQGLWWWPEAAEEIKTHNNHILVALMNADDLDAVDTALLATRIAACVAEDVDAIAVNWGAAGVVHKADVFIDDARKASRDNLPILMWVGSHLFKSEDDEPGIFTYGLAELGFPEVEVPAAPLPPSELIPFVLDFASYMVGSGVRFEDGETMGRTADEKWQITFGPSMIDRGEVLKLMPPG